MRGLSENVSGTFLCTADYKLESEKMSNSSVSLLRGLRDTIVVAKSRGFIRHALDYEKVEAKLSGFSNLRFRGREFLESKRIEYLALKKHGLERLSNDNEVLGNIFELLALEGLLEKYSTDEISTVNKARVVEAVFGELEYNIHLFDKDLEDVMFEGSTKVLCDKERNGDSSLRTSELTHVDRDDGQNSESR